MKKRVYEVSLLNVFFTLLVIFIHVSSDAVVNLDKTELPYMVVMTLWRMSSFVVQGFVFLSGFKMFYTLKEPLNLKKFYLSRLTKIFLPYCLWVVIYYLCYLAARYVSGPNHISNLVKYIFTGSIAAQFYFIILIVQFYLLAPLWVLIRKKVNPIVALVVSFAIMYFCNIYLPSILWGRGINFAYNDRTFTTYLFYFISGIYTATYYEKITAFLRKNFAFVTVLFVLVATANTVITYMWQTERLTGNIINIMHIVYCITAIFFFYALFLKCQKLSENGFVKNIDSASYYIYLTHMLFLIFIDGVMNRMGILAVKFSYPIRAIFVYGVSLAVCIGYVKLKKMIIVHKKV